MKAHVSNNFGWKSVQWQDSDLIPFYRDYFKFSPRCAKLGILTKIESLITLMMSFDTYDVIIKCLWKKSNNWFLGPRTEFRIKIDRNFNIVTVSWMYGKFRNLENFFTDFFKHQTNAYTPIWDAYAYSRAKKLSKEIKKTTL